VEKDSLPRTVEILKPSDFYKEGHRKIFKAMITLFERSEPVDLPTLRDEVIRAGRRVRVAEEDYRRFLAERRVPAREEARR